MFTVGIVTTRITITIKYATSKMDMSSAQCEPLRVCTVNPYRDILYYALHQGKILHFVSTLDPDASLEIHPRIITDPPLPSILALPLQLHFQLYAQVTRILVVAGVGMNLACALVRRCFFLFLVRH